MVLELIDFRVNQYYNWLYHILNYKEQAIDKLISDPKIDIY